MKHYVFDKESRKSSKTIGASTVNNFIINTIVPFLFLYSIKKNKIDYREKALKLLEQIKPEKNNIINKWIECRIKVDNAFDTQALIELKNEYCSRKRCLECRIGHSLLSNS